MSKTVLMWCSSTESGIQTMVPVLVVETELEDQDWDQNQVSSVGRYWNACCAYVEHRGHRTCRRYFISAVHGKLHTLIVLHVVWYYYFAYAGLNKSFFLSRIVSLSDIHFKNFTLACLLSFECQHFLMQWTIKKQWLSLHQGPTHRLEINTPKDGLNMNDLSTDEEEHVHGQMKNYEKKIENLMSEMGSLKTEVGIVRNHWKLNQSHISCILIMWPPTPHNHHQQCKKRKNPKHPPPPPQPPNHLYQHLKFKK